MFDFKEKTFIITGAAQGIGYEVAKGVVAGGGKVVILDLNAEKGQKTADSFNGSACFYPIDLANPKIIRETLKTVKKEVPNISGLVNVAGIVSTKAFEDIDNVEFERTVNINLTGTYTTCNEMYSYFVEKGHGRIVNVSSVAGKIGGGLLGTAAYAASKAGVNGLTKAIAKEGGPKGVSCNAVCPSFTLTPMTSKLQSNKDLYEKVMAITPLRRPADPSEPAQMILFFASEAASYVNGEIGDCDGGIVLD